jgi:hypothetical protein
VRILRSQVDGDALVEEVAVALVEEVPVAAPVVKCGSHASSAAVNICMPVANEALKSTSPARPLMRSETCTWPVYTTP